MKSVLGTIGLSLLLIAGYYLGRHLYLKPKNITGEKAAEIKGTLQDGRPFQLSSLQGKYILVDFWGSWCKPCRESHPQLVDLFQKLKSQEFNDADGFEIVSIGLEQNRKNWENAIFEDKLTWPYHLMETGSFDAPQLKAYSVKQIPTKFLVNPQGRIMAVDPTFDEIEKMLISRIKK